MICDRCNINSTFKNSKKCEKCLDIIDKEYKRKWYINNRDRMLELGKINSKKYYSENKAKRKIQQKNYYYKNLDKYKILRKRRKQNKRQEIHEYEKNRINNDPKLKIERSLRGRLWTILKIKNVKKKYRASELIGCTIPFLKLYLESKFLPTMAWENYGKYWHIDHVIPCCKFDLTKEEEQKKCFHYTNLQPLFAVTQIIEGIEYIGNLNKSKKLYDRHQY